MRRPQLPRHLASLGERELVDKLDSLGLGLNGYAMHYCGDDAFKLGAFTHPDPKTRRAAIDLTKRGLDSLAAASGN
jgi:hypothetical protein